MFYGIMWPKIHSEHKLYFVCVWVGGGGVFYSTEEHIIHLPILQFDYGVGKRCVASNY